MPKNAQTTIYVHSFYMLASNVQILQARLQQYMYWELPDVQAGFRKGTGTSDQTVNICWIIEKAREFKENIYFCFIEHAKPLTVWITTNWKILKEMGISALPASWEMCMSQEATESDMEQWTGSILGKEYVKPVYCPSTYLTSVQSTWCEMPGWMPHKLESKLPGEKSITSDMQMTPP